MIQDEIMKLQTYKMFEGEDTVYVERDDVLEVLKQKPCEDAISRQAVLDAVRKNTFRLTFAEEQGCEDHVAWSAEAVYSDVIEGALLELPPITPIHRDRTVQDFADKCRECGREKVLDKIKEEIRELVTFDTVDVLVEISRIIDKYKAESGDKE